MAEGREKWIEVFVFLIVAGVIFLWLLPQIITALITFFAVVFFIGFFYEILRHRSRKEFGGYQN